MKTKIENEAEFAEAINQYGDALAAVEKLNEDAKTLKMMLESYALENKVSHHETDRYALKMKKEEPALQRKKDTKEEDVVKLLKKTDAGKVYLIVTYDRAKLKNDLAGTPTGREALDSYGLQLTEPKKHVEVKPLR